MDRLAPRLRPICRYSSSSARGAASIATTSAYNSAQSSPPTSSPSTASSEAVEARRAQPFIPKPLARTYQISSLSPTPNDAHSTTINLQLGDSRSSTRSISLPNLYLRDSSIHSTHVHPSSQQRLFRSSDIPVDSKVIGYGVHEIEGKDHLVMEWNQPVKGVDTKTSKLSVTPLNLLIDVLEGRSERDSVPRARGWKKETLERRLRSFDYAQFRQSEQTLFEVVDSMLIEGLTFLKNVPTDGKEGQDTELRELVTRIASIRRTWYGDLFDVKAEQGSKNIAYTNLDLGLHMDLIHFAHPPRWQFLQSLLNGGIVGGASYFVDSYAVALSIFESDPEAFRILCSEPMRFEYKNGGYHTRFDRPTIELSSKSTSSNPIISAVNYSPPFQGHLPLSPTDYSSSSRLAALHQALGLFADRCDSSEYRYEVQLQPGDCAIFDNRRVLHARTAFEFVDHPEGAEEVERGRWLKGAYCDGDEVLSRWRVLNEKRRREGGLK